MEPPVSDPSATGTAPAATSAAEPPLEPPGVRVSSQGLSTAPKAEFSLDDPIANSSQLVLATITAPAASSRSTTVASYGAMNRSRMREPAVVRVPRAQMLSLIATGTPASGSLARCSSSRASTAAARSRARSAVTVRTALSRPASASAAIAASQARAAAAVPVGSRSTTLMRRSPVARGTSRPSRWRRWRWRVRRGRRARAVARRHADRPRLPRCGP